MLLPVALIVGGGVWLWDGSGTGVQVASEAQFTSNNAGEGITKADNSEWLDWEPSLETIRQQQAPTEELEPIVIEKEAVWFSVDISGRRQVRERLVYRIENYQPDYTYTINFGNGVEKPMEESITYRYPLPGHFDMKLAAVSPDGDTVEYIKKYEILPAGNTATAQVSQP